MALISLKSVVIFVLISPCLIHLSLAAGLQFLVPHNEARAQVGVPPLTWNTTLAAYARSYGLQRRGDCKLEHSKGPFGECLAEGYGDGMNASVAVGLWVGEKPNYDYESNSCVGGPCGHYTQVVWRNSVHLGCARIKCSNDWRFVICSYDPPGNYIGERPY